MAPVTGLPIALPMLLPLACFKLHAPFRATNFKFPERPLPFAQSLPFAENTLPYALAWLLSGLS